jgi:poly(A) polymerase
MVIHRGRMVEVTTFRSDISYTDGRHPDAVRFSTPPEDAARRDFTINGMFHDPIADEVIDHVGGREDLEHGIIRTIGPSEQRFAEDYLRMIRAVRFAVRLEFRIDDATAEAIRQLAPHILEISGERICDELTKMLDEPSGADALVTLHNLKLAEQILPELFDPPELWDRGIQRARCVADATQASLALGAMVCELSPATIRGIVNRWGQSNDLKGELLFYAEHLDAWRKAFEMPLHNFKRLLASPHFDGLRRLWRAEELRKTGKLEIDERLTERIAGIDPAKIAPDPFVTGADLQAMGLAEGRTLGRILNQVYDEQLDERFATPGEATARARELINQSRG